MFILFKICDSLAKNQSGNWERDEGVLKNLRLFMHNTMIHYVKIFFALETFRLNPIFYHKYSNASDFTIFFCYMIFFN